MFKITKACSILVNEGAIVKFKVEPTVLYCGTFSELEKFMFRLAVFMDGK